MKQEYFKQEYNYIKDEKYKQNLKTLIELLPDYFFEVPASSTGKYHPEFSLGKGGLLRHSKFAAKLAYELYKDESLTGMFNEREKDLMIIALLLHDGLKSGIVKETYTRFDHPILMANFIRENKSSLTLSNEDIEFIASCIETHMGPWTCDYRGNEILKKPTSKYQLFVHMCDFLASRKFINTKYLDNDLID